MHVCLLPLLPRLSKRVLACAAIPKGNVGNSSSPLLEGDCTLSFLFVVTL